MRYGTSQVEHAFQCCKIQYYYSQKHNVLLTLGEALR
jgi:hypothetical protein